METVYINWWAFADDVVILGKNEKDLSKNLEICIRHETTKNKWRKTKNNNETNVQLEEKRWEEASSNI